MNITNVKVFKLNQPINGLLANVTLEIDGDMWISNLTLREGKNGMFVSMPSIKLNKPDKDGKEYRDIVLIKKEAREEMQRMVINMYNGQAEEDIDSDLPF